MLKQKDKEALRDWEAHKKSIEQATVVFLDETYSEKKARIAKLLEDPCEFSKYYFPHYCQAEFADFQKEFFEFVSDNQRAYAVNEWSRDHAKSVVTDVLAVVYLKCKGEAKNLILASHNEENAIDLLTPLKLEFEKNQRIIYDYGKQETPGRWEGHKFITMDGCSFRAVGAGQSPRGSRDEEARPDIIIVDDIDTEEVCRNSERLRLLWEWVSGALFGCFSIQGRKRFIIVGNKIAPDCIIERAKKESEYHKQVNILTKGKVDQLYIKEIKKQASTVDPESKDLRVWKECVKYAELGYKPTWHQRFTMFDCVYMIVKMGYRMSQREYFNNPISEGKVFKKAWMQYKALPKMREYQYLMAYLDPGFKKTATSDSKSLILVAMHKSEFHIRKVFCGKASVEEMIEWCYSTDSYVKANQASYRLKMEEVFLQSLLYKDFTAAGITKGYQLPVTGDKRKKPDKDARIEAMEGYFERGVIFFDEEIKEEHHTQALVEQLLNFEPGVKTLKDGPDALEGAIHLLQQSLALSTDVVVGRHLPNKKKV